LPKSSLHLCDVKFQENPLFMPLPGLNVT
jgi:hypothetical protein